MLTSQRRNKIKEILLKEKSVKVNDLVKLFGVSEETIRRDLGALEKQNLVKRSYGGAILTDELQLVMTNIPTVQQRKLLFFKEKDAIGKLAASLVSEKQIVILDAGSTTWSVARYLKDFSEITVVSNSIDIAQELGQSEGAAVFIVGGKLSKRSMSLVGPQAEIEIKKYNAHIVFLGTTAISTSRGEFLSSDIYEAELKKVMAKSAQTKVVVADHSKFDKHGLIAFSSFEDIDILITSDLVDPDILKQIESKGIKIMTCHVDID